MNAAKSVHLARWMVPICLVLCAWLLVVSLPASSHRPVYSAFFAAIVLSVLAGGWFSAAIALVLSVSSLAYFFLPPAYSFRIGLNDFINLTVFTILAVLTTAVDASRRRAEHRQAEASRERDQAIGRLEELRKLVPYCVECRRPFDDAAHWAEVESHLASLARRRCLCPQCTDKIFKAP